ncbi:hypothetical protein LXA43DRAFT_301216 [Ganoderma leucocontextum]|nr:hypothetical protein LXA43DRAFT_301216 [Ganoderma leucocontextum]
MSLNNQPLNIPGHQEEATRIKQGGAFAGGIGGPAGVDVGAVVGNMEAAGVCSLSHALYQKHGPDRLSLQIQRTPIVNRTMAGGPIGVQTTSTSTWRQPQPATHVRGRQAAQRHPFSAMDGSYRTSVSTARSDRSGSTAEVENLLAQTGRYAHARNPNAQWSNNMPQVQSVHSTPARVSTAQAGARGSVSPPSFASPVWYLPPVRHAQVSPSLRANASGRSSNPPECPWDRTNRILKTRRVGDQPARDGDEV